MRFVTSVAGGMVMFKSLHMKLVLIMLLLIISIMAIVGAFLINGVAGFFTNEFYDQMQSAFSRADFVADLRAEAAEEGGAEHISDRLHAWSGVLGINTGTRNYYVLDGQTGRFITGSDMEAGANLQITPNILTALSGSEGYQSSWTSSYMDVALPISGGGNSYIIYIKDTGETVGDLNTELFMIIIEALVIGLVISVLLSFLLSKSMVAPIESLTVGAERIAAGDFSRRLEVSSKDEIGVLTGTFNNMAQVLSDTLEEMENERTKLNTLFLHMTDGVIAFDKDGKLIQKNPAAEQLLGREITVESTYDGIFGAVYDFEKLLRLRSPDSVAVEYNFGDRDFELYMASFYGEGLLGGVLIVIHDVTQQKKAEEIRQEFVANVSHELRTPLTNVQSYAETLVDNEELPPETVAGFLNVILSETNRMTNIVQDLLTLSRFDYGRSEMSLERINVYDAIEKVYNAVRIDAKRHDHILLLDIKNDLPPVKANRARLEQVIMNILSNALKYTPNGGTIRIAANTQGRSLVITVSDNGIGIPKEDLPRIFERFYRVDKARSREHGGTGLGLAIAREIMLQHHGDIKLESEVGVGTTVRIILPIDEVDANEQ